jgi:hypothetical protein
VRRSGGRQEALQERIPEKCGGAEGARRADGADRDGRCGERKEASHEQVPKEDGGVPVESSVELQVASVASPSTSSKSGTSCTPRGQAARAASELDGLSLF